MSDLSPLSDAALDRLFRQARTVYAFQPVRYVFVRSAQAKASLLPFDEAARIV